MCSHLYNARAGSFVTLSDLATSAVADEPRATDAATDVVRAILRRPPSQLSTSKSPQAADLYLMLGYNLLHHPDLEITR
jgi:hypothetical protein